MHFHRIDWAPGTPDEESPEFADALMSGDAKAVGCALRCSRCAAILEVRPPWPLRAGDPDDGLDGYAAEFAASLRWIEDGAEGFLCPAHHKQPAVPLDDRWSEDAWGPPGPDDERFEDDGAGEDDGDFEAEEGLDAGGGDEDDDEEDVPD